MDLYVDVTDSKDFFAEPLPDFKPVNDCGVPTDLVFEDVPSKEDLDVFWSFFRGEALLLVCEVNEIVVSLMLGVKGDATDLLFCPDLTEDDDCRLEPVGDRLAELREDRDRDFLFTDLGVLGPDEESVLISVDKKDELASSRDFLAFEEFTWVLFCDPEEDLADLFVDDFFLKLDFEVEGVC